MSNESHNTSLAHLVGEFCTEIVAFQNQLDERLGLILKAAPEELEAQKELVETLQHLVGMLRKSAQLAEGRAQKIGLTTRCSNCHKVVEFVGKAGRWPEHKEGGAMESFARKKCDGCRECEGIFCFDCAKSCEQRCRLG